MFEKIVLRRSEGGAALTAGELAEALLYYQNVHLVLDRGAISSLEPSIGLKTILNLLHRPNFSAVYCEDQLGTHSETKAGRRTHSFISFMAAGSKEYGQANTRKKRFQFILERHGHNKRDAKKLTERFRKAVPIKKLESDYFLEGGIINAALDDLEEENFTHEVINRALSKLLPGVTLPKDLVFKVEIHRPSFHIITNLDFTKLNKIIKTKNPSASEVTEAHLIANVLSARGELTLAAHYGGEYYTSDVCSEIIRVRQAELLKRIGLEKTEKDLFQEVVLHNGRAVREAINSGEQSFDDFLKLLDKAEKFKEWIRGVNPDEKLVRAYMDEVAALDWINKIPVKSARYILGSLIGTIDPVSGLAVSAGDSFLLEKLCGGWRPSHFVKQRLQPFVDPEGK